MFRFGVIWKILLLWWLVLIFTLDIQARDTGRRQKRETKPCPGVSGRLPEISKSRMCRCLHRPDYQNPKTSVFTPVPQDVYTLQAIEMDLVNFGPTYFPENAYTACVYFGHAGTNVPALQRTPELVIQAINEYGWPTGTWTVAEFKAACTGAPTNLIRTTIQNITLYKYERCYDADRTWGQEEGFYTEGNKIDNPNLLHFFNPIAKKYGLIALFHVNADNPLLRPKQLKFVVEAPYTNSTPIKLVKMLRMESETYDVKYDITNEMITLEPSSTDIDLSLDFAYQVRTKKIKRPKPDTCLEPPEPPPPIPFYPENSCACIIKPRQPTYIEVAGGTKHLHHRLNISSSIPPFQDNAVVDLEIHEFFEKYKDFYIHNPTLPGMERLLVYIYHFLPVYKDRQWREREVIISVFDHKGFPQGVFLDPFLPADEALYYAACDDAIKSLNNPEIFWTRPAMPSGGECYPRDKNFPNKEKACYFHLYTDYFFVDCVEFCEAPKYICTVWKYEDPDPAKPIPFEFQFISNAVYYQNKDASEGSFELPPDATPCQTTSSIPGIKEWNLLETQLYNQAYHKRSDVWMYLPHTPQLFMYVAESDINTLVILDENYVNETRHNKQFCVEPLTYYVEPKDNNLCVCTFWGDDSIDTWQTHYGRTSSCTWKKETIDFRDHFKIDIHSKQADNIKVRVYADLSPPYERLLEDYFVLHAIYIQGLDQFGIPVGKFRKGHWIDQLNPNDPLCPNSQFPPNTNAVQQQYPIFEVQDCPYVADYTAKESIVLNKYITTNAPYRPEIFIYSNRWKDHYPIVCALFQFNPKHYPHVTEVQLLAFIRIEDKHDEGHAYMVELRTGFINVSDMATATPQSFAKGEYEDKNVSYPPLNYGYYKLTVKPTPTQWERECLTAVREPGRKFDVCRHYITTPVTVKYADKVDLDSEIDVFNKYCAQWILSNQKFGPTHPFTAKLANKLTESNKSRDTALQDKECFTLQAFKTRRKNAWHVRFRVIHKNQSEFCERYNIPYLKEAALVAYNEEGFPIGRPGGNIFGGGSFELYNHYKTQQDGAHEHCADDDIQLTLDDENENKDMVFHSERGKCIWADNTAIEAYKTKMSSFHQDFDLPSDEYVPSMMIWGNFKKLYNGFCAIWYYPKITKAGVTPPKTVQFVMQVQIVQKGVNPPIVDTPNGPGARNRVLTIRSPRYLFSYDSTVTKHITIGKPDNFQDSIDPQNLDGTVSMNCHEEEMPIYEDKRPSDKCVCELRSTLVSPPPDQPPLCTLKYEFYNSIFDNRLYRICLQLERRRDSDMNFKYDECRTKIDYPRPPEIFPNEQITLEGTDENEYNNTVVFEPFDPTDNAFFACGLIKKCISRHANERVENDCIKDKSCDMIVTFGKGLGEAHHPHDEITMEIFAVSRGWAAVGISKDDDYMGEDYVVECDKEGGMVNMYHSWNIKTGQVGKPIHSNYRMRGDMGLHSRRNRIIRPVKAVFYQEKLYCKFYIKKIFSITDPDLKEKHDYNLDTAYHYIMAFSHASTDPYGEDEGNLRIHVLNGQSSETGKRKVIAGERLSPLPYEARLYRLHALFMVFSWILFLTLSIFVARYFKETLIHIKIFKYEFWYFAHIVTAMLALLSLFIGVLFHLTASAGWRTQFRSNFHTYSGIVAFCLFIAEIIIGFILKQHSTGKRPLINWIHTILGHFAYNLAVFNMAFSKRVAYGFMPCNFDTYLFIWISVYYVLHAFMSYHYCWVNFNFAKNRMKLRFSTFNVLSRRSTRISTDVAGASTNRFLMKRQKKLEELEKRRSASQQNTAEEVLEAPGKSIRIAALFIFSVITCVYTFWIMRKVTSYARFCYDFYELKRLELGGFN